MGLVLSSIFVAFVAGIVTGIAGYVTYMQARSTEARDEFLEVERPVVTLSVISTPASTFNDYEVYGLSYNQLPLDVYRLGGGESARLIVGGIHGGYEWNTVEFVDNLLVHLRENPDLIPPAVTLYLIPCANPDGYLTGTDRVAGRMNGNGVDLNRNWDYEWQAFASHGTHAVSAGAYPFSEPETAALRDFILREDIELVLFYHSALGAVFPGEQPERSATDELAMMLAEVTVYSYQPGGVPGQITTGDAIDWLSAKQGIAGAEIEFSTHDSILGTEEWYRNLDGVLAFLNWSIP
jgi:hypothetical protein